MKSLIFTFEFDLYYPEIKLSYSFPLFSAHPLFKTFILEHSFANKISYEFFLVQKKSKTIISKWIRQNPKNIQNIQKKLLIVQFL